MAGALTRRGPTGARRNRLCEGGGRRDKHGRCRARTPESAGERDIHLESEVAGALRRALRRLSLFDHFRHKRASWAAPAQWLYPPREAGRPEMGRRCP